MEAGRSQTPTVRILDANSSWGAQQEKEIPLLNNSERKLTDVNV